MNTLPYLRPYDVTALQYLRDLALSGSGYRRRGGLGWARREDVESATGARLQERLARLHRKGLLDREDVRAHQVLRAVWIYRITQAGSDVLAKRERQPHRAIPPLQPLSDQSDAAVYIPPAAWTVLQDLRCAMEARACSEYLPGEPGWCTLNELRSRYGDEDETPEGGAWEGDSERWRGKRNPRDPSEEPWQDPSDPWQEMGDDDDFDDGEPGWDPLQGGMPRSPSRQRAHASELEWLVRSRLVQKWMVEGPGKRRVPVYRITSLGGVVIALEWNVFE